MEDRNEGFVAAHTAEQNRLLRALTLADYATLLPQLRPIRLTLKQIIVEAEQRLDYVYFPREGVCSVVATEQSGGPIEIGTVGNEGLVGLPVVLSSDSSAYRVIVQSEGHAWRLEADAFRTMLDERPPVRQLMLRYAYYADMVSQSVACNRLHTIEERCARWLLVTHDRVEGDTFELTHEFISMTLGVRRAGVTVALGALQAQGIIRVGRGSLTVLDRKRLEEAACSCYAITRAQMGKVLGPEFLAPPPAA